MIQFHKFENGGFVLHKIMIRGTKYSAWFDARGNLLGAEQFCRNCTRNVAQRCNRILQILQIQGKGYVDYSND